MRRLLLLLPLLLAHCAAPSPPAEGTVGFLDQGWSAETRAWMYTFSQGSQIMPWSWFTALEHEDGSATKFAADGLARFGYLPRGQPGAARGLPVGFTVGRGNAALPGNDRAFLGMNCAACHTGRMTIAGHVVQVDGAPAMADFQRFIVALEAALRATAANPDRRARFTEAVAAAEPDAGSAAEIGRQLDRQAASWATFIDQSTRAGPPGRRTPITAWGPGRNDAFGMIFNRALGMNLGIPGNIQPPDGPVSYPFLWTTHRQTWVQWNGGVDNRNFLGRLSRNVGQVLGVFGHAPTLADPDRLRAEGLVTSVEITALLSAETAVAALRPPAWPAWAPQPDPAQVAAGERLYDTHCASCHVRVRNVRGAPPLFGARDIAVFCTPLDTDARAVDNILGRRPRQDGRVRTGALAGWTGVNDVLSAVPILSDREDGVRTLRVAALGAILDGRLTRPVGAGDVLAPEPPDAVRFYDAREGLVLVRDLLRSRAPQSAYAAQPDTAPGANEGPRACGSPAAVADRRHYKAGPLHGIWATGPFLHNGSVRTMDELLQPARARARSFRVGGTVLDTTRLGFEESSGPGTAVFDTRRPGNGNQGHVYPAGGLSPADRAALLAYLTVL